MPNTTSPAFSRVAAAFHTLDGRDIRPGRNTSCPVHGHGRGRGDRRPSLSVSVNERGVGLHCKAGCTVEAICAALDMAISELFDDDFHSGGPTLQRSNSPTTIARSARPAHEVEELLCGVERGEFMPREVRVPPLPGGASEPMQRVAAFAARVAGVQVWADCEDPDEFWFAKRWVARWTGLPESTAQRAIRRLRECGWLVFVREAEPLRPQDAHGTSVFRIAAPVPCERCGQVLAADAATHERVRAAYGRLLCLECSLAVEQVVPAAPAFAGRVEADDAGRVDEG